MALEPVSRQSPYGGNFVCEGRAHIKSASFVAIFVTIRPQQSPQLPTCPPEAAAPNSHPASFGRLADDPVPSPLPARKASVRMLHRLTPLVALLLATSTTSHPTATPNDAGRLLCRAVDVVGLPPMESVCYKQPYNVAALKAAPKPHLTRRTTKLASASTPGTLPTSRASAAGTRTAMPRTSGSSCCSTATCTTAPIRRWPTALSLSFSLTGCATAIPCRTGARQGGRMGSAAASPCTSTVRMIYVLDLTQHSHALP